MHHQSGNTLLWPFLVYGIAVVALVSGMLFLSYFLGERHEEPATNEVYEGGVIADGTARLLFPIHFYIIALFFVIFDVQAVFIIAWSVCVKTLGWPGYIAICTFTGISACLLLYEWTIGALEFGPDSKKILAAYREKIKSTINYDVVDKQSK
jgi:NADH-quinone oxidoreductase subunit A